MRISMVSSLNLHNNKDPTDTESNTAMLSLIMIKTSKMWFIKTAIPKNNKIDKKQIGKVTK